MKEVGAQNAMGNFGLSLTSAQPSGEELCWYVTGDVLYWDAKLGEQTMFFQQEKDKIFLIHQSEERYVRIHLVGSLAEE